MAGTSEGAKKAIETKRRMYGDDFFSVAGKAGGIARNNSDKKHIPFKDKKFAKLMAHKAAEARWGDKSLQD